MNNGSGLIAYTCGEPAGIGMDLAVLLASGAQTYPLVVIGDPQVLSERTRLLGKSLDIALFQPENKPPSEISSGQGKLLCLPIQTKVPVIPGQLDMANAPYVLQCLDIAHQEIIRGTFGSLLTGPVHKGIINDAGISFSGHTEYLAGLCQVKQVVMMLACDGLRVALATTHLPLREVSVHITRQKIMDVIQIIHTDLKQRFGIAQPHIFVCGLNPHAGEGGHLGREEMEEIIPALESLRARGMRITGPLPADTIFSPGNLARADVFLAMYHDQGLPVLKYKGFGAAVNITLGLPYLRVSVDHGSALDIAGKATRISSGSLYYAIEYLNKP